jgi:hypothetical protein
MISNCDDVRGMLPWLLTGALDDDERQKVVSHLATCASCRQELADTRLAAEIFDQHPPTEAILALAWDEPPPGFDPAEVADLEDHVASCPRCAAELELARMSRHLEEDERVVPLARRSTPAPAPSRGWRGWKSAALAAGLAGLVASAGWIQTAGRVQTLEEQLAERTVAPAPVTPAPSNAGAGAPADYEQRIEQLTEELNQTRQQAETLSQQVEQIAQGAPGKPAPQVISRVLTLDTAGDVVRGATDAPVQEITTRESAVLLLDAAHSETATHRSHAVEIVNASGTVAWKATGLQLDPDSPLYILALPSGALPAGSYTIRAYGITGGKPEPLESYRIRVR